MSHECAGDLVPPLSLSRLTAGAHTAASPASPAFRPAASTQPSRSRRQPIAPSREPSHGPPAPATRKAASSRGSSRRGRSRVRTASEQMSGRCRQRANAGRTRPRDHHDHDAVDRIPRRVGARSGRLDQEMSTIAPGGRTTNRDSREPDGPDSDLARSIAPGA